MLWLNETFGRFNDPLGSAPGYLPAPDKRRWEKLRVARLLFEGKHRIYFLDEQRSQFDYPQLRVNDRIIRPYVTFNLLRLISIKTADLLFGAKAKIDAPTPAQRDRLDLMARKSLLHSRFHAASVQASWAGGAFLESLLWRGEPYVSLIDADEMFPQGQINPDGQYDRYVRYATTNLGTQQAPMLALLETHYLAGSIERHLWQIDRRGNRQRELSLDQWPPFAGGDLPEPVQQTGLSDNTITYLPNELGGQLEVSDYDGLIHLQDSVNAKFSQIARVLAKHADPKLAAPQADASPDGTLPSQADVFFFRSADEIPRYIVWSAELDAAMRDRDASIDALCIAAEMSQVIIGIKRGAAPDAARKLRLEATNILAKVGRKALVMEPAIARAIETTQRLDQTSSLRRQYPVDAIGVEMRDGLPTDPLDDAQVVSLLRSARVMSIENAVESRMEDPDAAAVEVQRIKKEESEAAPTMLLGGGPIGQDQSSTPSPAPATAEEQLGVAA